LRRKGTAKIAVAVLAAGSLSPTQNSTPISLGKTISGWNVLSTHAKTVAMALVVALVVALAALALVALALVALAIALVAATGCHRGAETQHQGLLHQQN